MSDYTIPRQHADKHLLYEWSVQDPNHVINFAVEQYMQRRDRMPFLLREDFCGTALVASYWVKDHSERQAIAIDHDPETLAWAEKHNLAPLGPARHRVDLRQSDVRTVTSPVDIVLAVSFSTAHIYPLLELIDYFQNVRKSMAQGAILVVDCHGGWSTQQIYVEEYPVEIPDGTFGFIWEQSKFNPITNRARCHIHFAFKDGERWNNAFDYDLRFYSLAEICDALSLAGFSNIETFWNVSEDDWTFESATEAENCAGWMAFVVANAAG